MEAHYRFKALNGPTYTEMYVKDGKTFMNVYDEDGNLLDVMEEVASSTTPKECEAMNSTAKK